MMYTTHEVDAAFDAIFADEPWSAEEVTGSFKRQGVTASVVESNDTATDPAANDWSQV